MGYNETIFEKKILESPLFELDRETQYTAYKNEALKMVGYLYSYLMARNAAKYEDYGLEITKISKRCIKNFDGEKGNFLHYFNKAWSIEFSRIMMKKSEEEKYRGGHISETDRRNLRKVVKLMQMRGKDVNSPDVINILAESTSLREEEIREVIGLYKISVESDRVKNDDGEDSSIIDLFKASESTEETFIHKENTAEILNFIDNVYSSLQERQMQIFSDVFTAKLCEFIIGIDIAYDKVKFINREMLNDYIKTGQILSQRQIAERYGRDEASLSRTIKEFIKKLNALRGI